VLIEVDKLEDARGSFAHSYEALELDLEESRVLLVQDPRVSCRIVRTDNEVRLEGTVTAGTEVECDRCLKGVTIQVDRAFNVSYVNADQFDEGAVELQPDDLIQSVFDGVAIDVDELVREQILLELPTRVLCSEECKGLCPICGSDRNTQTCPCDERPPDPRWEALRLVKLKE
jgi:uncharacterized protein